MRTIINCFVDVVDKTYDHNIAMAIDLKLCTHILKYITDENRMIANMMTKKALIKEVWSD